jgi:uncharacterized protein Ymh
VKKMIDLHERLSEFSYGYGVTREVEALLMSVGLHATPFLPSLLHEAMDSPQAERQAVMEMFSGAIGHGRNPPSHRDIVIKRENAAQLIGLASYLLFLVDRIVAPRIV